MITLRPYQEAAIEGVRNAYRRGRRAPLLVMPTGGGKTVCFARIAQGAAAKGKRVLICVHRAELLSQCAEKLEELGVEHGCISPDYRPKYFLPVQVASIQTLVRRFGQIERPDLVIFDEAHHVTTANQWGQVRNAYEKALTLGVTATPCRLDGKSLGDTFDQIVEGPSVLELTRAGYLAPAAYFASQLRVDLAAVKTRAGDYAQDQLEEVMDKPALTGDAVEHYQRTAPNQAAIAFCVSVKHAEHVAEQFRLAGFNAAALDGKTDPVTRKATIAALARGELHVLASCNLISEGTDIPRVEVGIMLRPTKSLSLWLQQVGRCLRVAPGKERATILDHAGNVFVHGFAHDPRAWSLEPKKKRKATEALPAVRNCPDCFCAHPPAPYCPQCGHVYFTAEARELETVEGDLVELGADLQARIRAQRKAEERNAQTLEELQALGRARGYSDGWARHRYEARQRKGYAR